MAEDKKKIEEQKQPEPSKPEISSKDAIASFFDEIPVQEPILVAIGGGEGLGKTHFWNTFPKPVVGDTEGRAHIVMKKFGHNYRKHVKNMESVRNTITMMAQHLCPDIAERHKWTFVLDSASDFQQMAESEWLKEAKKDKVFPLVLWAKVYDKMDTVFDIIRKLGFNAVFTQQIKEKYVNEKATGEYEISGYKKIPYRVDVRLFLKKGVELDGEIYYPDIVVAEVLKDCWNKPESRKPYLIDISYDGIFKELKAYKHPGTKEEAIKLVLKELATRTGIPVEKAKATNKG